MFCLKFLFGFTLFPAPKLCVPICTLLTVLTKHKSNKVVYMTMYPLLLLAKNTNITCLPWNEIIYKGIYCIIRLICMNSYCMCKPIVRLLLERGCVSSLHLPVCLDMVRCRKCGWSRVFHISMLACWTKEMLYRAYTIQKYHNYCHLNLS